MAVQAKRARLPITQRARSPLQQGNLDSLCGVYAIINAIRCVCPKVSNGHAHWLFELLNRTLAKQNPSHAKNGSMAYRGLNRRELRRLIEVARENLAFKFGIRFRVERLPRRGKRRWRLAELWSLLDGQISLGGVAVLGLGGCHSHWSVAIQVTPKQLRLFDSDRLRTIRRQRCTVGHTRTRIRILPAEVFLFASVTQLPPAGQAGKQRRRSLQPWASP